MSIKITVPNTGSDYLTFGSANTPTAAQIGGYDDGSSNGHLEFYTTASGTSTERMHIDNAGNVGIGTSSPSAKLDVNGAINLGQSYINLASPNGANGDWVGGYNINYSTGVKNVATGSSNGIYQSSGGYIAFHTNASQTPGTTVPERARINSNGEFLVGTTTAQSAKIVALTTGGASISCAQTGTSGDQIYFRTSTSTLAGYITCPTGTTTTYNSISDYRLKSNPQPLSNSLSKVLQLKPCSYTWISDNTQDQGFIAHELQEIVPSAVNGVKDGVNEDGSPKYQAIDTGSAPLIALLTAAIQELKAIIDTQAAKIAALEAK